MLDYYDRKYHGKDREETLQRAMRGKLDVVLTTYETFRIYLVSDVRAMRGKLDVVLTTNETFRIYLVSDARAVKGKT